MAADDKRALYNGFGNTLASAFELAAVPLIFGLIGWAVDGWLGTRPLMVVVLVLIALVGLGVRTYYRYEHEMREHDAAGAWARGGQSWAPPATAVGDHEPSPLDAPPVEAQVVADMVRRALPMVPVALVIAALLRGADGAASTGYGILIILVNFAASAALLTWAGRRSLGLLMGTALFGYVLRLALLTVAVLAITGQAWFDPVALGATIVITHLGLLVWETRFVSMSLAYPGLKPTLSRKD